MGFLMLLFVLLMKQFVRDVYYYYYLYSYCLYQRAPRKHEAMSFQTNEIKYYVHICNVQNTSMIKSKNQTNNIQYHCCWIKPELLACGGSKSTIIGTFSTSVKGGCSYR